MPIGYIVGKQYRLDTNYDRFATLDCWKRILRHMTKLGYGLEIKYSHVGRNYTGEVKEMMRFDKSAHVYLVSKSLKHGPDPLSAMIAAIRQAIEPDIILQALFLEAEAALLRMTFLEAVEAEKKIERQLDALSGLLELTAAMFMAGEIVPFTEPLSADPSDIAAAHWEDIQTGAREYPEDLDDDL